MLVISGKSCTGKDTVVKELVKLGYNKLVTYTTRPIRAYDNEVDGVTYHFLSVEDFLVKYINGFFLEVNYYTTDTGILFYGSSIESYKNATDDTVGILTPSGIRKLNENAIKNTSVMIDISDEEILKRQILRKDKPVEAERRFKADKLDFKDCETLMDYIIVNENIDAKTVAKTIDKLHKEELNE